MLKGVVGGGGSVASVSFTTLSSEFAIGGSPVTQSGTFTFGFRAPQLVAHGGTGMGSFLANSIIRAGTTSTAKFTSIATLALSSAYLDSNAAFTFPPAQPIRDGLSSSFMNGLGTFGAPPSQVMSGSGFAPVVSAETNLAGTTMSTVKWSRVGNIVTMSGQFTADPTLTATPTSFEFTLPVGSNIAAANDLSGTAVCGNIAGMCAELDGSVANDTAVVQWVASDPNANTWSWTAQYEVK